MNGGLLRASGSSALSSNAEGLIQLPGSSWLWSNRRLQDKEPAIKQPGASFQSSQHGCSRQQQLAVKSWWQRVQNQGKAVSEDGSAGRPKASPTAATEGQLIETQPQHQLPWRQQQQHRRLAADSPAEFNHSCWEGFPGFPASSGRDLRRLLEDPAANRIELQGDIVFDEENFRPPPPGSPCIALNVTHRVEIRACKRPPDKPIIVDTNRLGQFICVYGYMLWQGNMKFINIEPSPRRAFLYPLISSLSVEQGGIIVFEDVTIHGDVPSPLHEKEAPFWNMYGNDPGFVPQPDDYKNISYHEVLLVDWRFNKTAWVLASQGANGTVKAVGNGYWGYKDVTVIWSTPGASSGGLSPTMKSLAVALPVVFGTLAVGGLVGYLFRKKRRQRRAAAHELQEQQPEGVVGDMEGGKDDTGQHGSGFNSQDKVDEMQKWSVDRSLHDGSTGNASHASRSRSQRTEDRIEATRATIVRQKAAVVRTEEITLEEVLGEGTFGKVYKGIWKGTPVAVKSMVFPANMSGKEKREKMAIMETAISSSLSHPNVVQTYTYAIKPVFGDRPAQSQATSSDRPEPTMGLHLGSGFTGYSSFVLAEDSEQDVAAWEVQLVLEYCDLGSLREELDQGLFDMEGGAKDMHAVLATAIDVARAMLHLHSEHILHSDLKARNILLKSSGADRRGFVAKVADFGLSLRMDPNETHVSNMYQGTMTHMAPELLMYGKLSPASDVYAFGILLWELYTCQSAFRGMPKALLGHEVARNQRRPDFPKGCPVNYQLLACRCWETDASIRPGFAQILDELQRMQQLLPKPSSVVPCNKLALRPWHHGAMAPSSKLTKLAAAAEACAASSPMGTGEARAQQQQECGINTARNAANGVGVRAGAGAGQGVAEGPGAWVLGELEESPLGRYLAGSSLEAGSAASGPPPTGGLAGGGTMAAGILAGRNGSHVSPSLPEQGRLGGRNGSNWEQQQQAGHKQHHQPGQLAGCSGSGVSHLGAAGKEPGAADGAGAGSRGTSTILAEQLQAGLLRLEGSTLASNSSTGVYIDNSSTYAMGDHAGMRRSGSA